MRNDPVFGALSADARNVRGFTLLEVLISLGLLSLVVFSTIVVYTGQLSATSRADVNRDAVAALDTVTDIFSRRLQKAWPHDAPPDPPAAPITDTYDRFVYEVDDLGRLPNPLKPDEYMQVKAMAVRVDFQQLATDGSTVTHSYKLRVLVAK